MIRELVAQEATVLHETARDVDLDNMLYSDLSDLIADMFDTMYANDGVGLAAPQIGEGIRLFVWDVPNPMSPKLPRNKGHVINPELTIVGTHINADVEGCLSVPNTQHSLQRPARVRLSGKTVYGRLVNLTGTGYLARCFQHEYDHLNGILYLDRISQ